jgi:2'-5' RNA ligase
LLFLGSVAESRIPDLVALAGHAVSDADVLAAMTTPDRAVLVRPDFTFDRIEFWPKSHLLVAATSASLGPAHALAVELSGALRRRASALGLAPDLKPFRAHVTLARKVVRVSRALEMRPVRWSLDGFALVESRTEPEGAQYCVLERFVFV